MDNSVLEQGKERLSKRRQHKRELVLICILVLAVALSIIFLLLDPASDTSTSMALTDASVSGDDMVYDPDSDTYHLMNLRVDFSIVTDPKVSTYYYDYNPAIVIPKDLLNIRHDLMDNEGKKVGKYEYSKKEEGSYRVTAYINEEYIAEKGKNISGSIQFDGLLKSGLEGVDGNIVIQFTDAIDVTIPFHRIVYPDDTTANYNIDVMKDGYYAVKGDKLTYTVQVFSKKGTPDTIDFTDSLTTELKGYTLANIKVEKGIFNAYASWNSEANGKKTVFELSGEAARTGNSDSTVCRYSYADGKVHMELPALEEGEIRKDDSGNEYTQGNCYVITYTYDLNLDGTVNSTASNKVQVSSTDRNSGEKIVDEETKNLIIKKEYSLDKSGQYNNSNGQILWTININNKSCEIAGSVLMDDMFSEMEGVDCIYPDKGYEWITEEDKKVGIRFKGVEGGSNTDAYTIRYYTMPKSSWSGNTTNTAYFYPKGEEDSEGRIDTSATVTVGAGGGDISNQFVSAGKVDKSTETVELNWVAGIAVPNSGLPKGTVITDTMNDDWESYRPQYMTYTQMTNCGWPGQIGQGYGWMGKLGELQFKGTDGQWYSWSDISTKTEVQNLKFQCFQMVVQEDITPEDVTDSLIKLEYQTYADISKVSIGINDYYNQFDVGEKSTSDKYTYYKGGVVQYDGNNQTGTTSTTNEDGSLTWIVKVTMDNEDHDKLTITDSLPEDVILETLVFQDDTMENTITLAVDNSGDISVPSGEGSGRYSITGQYDRVSGNVTIDMKMADGNAIPNLAKYMVTYHCKTSGEILQETEDGKKYEFNNEVSVKNDDVEFGSSSQKQEWTLQLPEAESKEINLSGNWDADSHKISYSIVINKEKEDLASSGSTLTVVDKMSYYSSKQETREAELIPNSVKLYEARCNADTNEYEKGEEVTGWSWKFDASTDGYGNYTSAIKAKVPDEKALIMEYIYDVNMRYPGSWGNLGLCIKNTASIIGTEYSSTEDGNDWVWNISGGVNTNFTYTLYKVEEGNFGNMLQGATFTLYKNKDGRYVDTGITYGSDANGIIKISAADGNVYEKNVLYKLVETAAPPGYLLPEEGEEYYFYFSDEDSENMLPDTIPGRAVDVAHESGVDYVENGKTSTTIEVEKQWYNAKGSNTTSRLSGTVTFDLYQSSKTVDGKMDLAKNTPIGSSVTQNSYSYVMDVDQLFGDYPEGTVMNYRLYYRWGEWRKFDNRFKELEADVDGTPQSLLRREETECEKGQTYFVYDISFIVGTNHMVAITVPEAKNTDWFGYVASVQIPPVKYGTYTISKETDWIWKNEELPRSGEDSYGNKVSYSYFVEEQPVTNYKTTYEDNGGIESGKITIRNRQNPVAEYEISATGGYGTRWYTMGGVLMILAAGFLMYKKIQK